jgi:hypothetical protein
MTEGPLTTSYFPVLPELEALLRLQDRLLNVSRLATVGEMSSGIARVAIGAEGSPCLAVLGSTAASIASMMHCQPRMRMRS